jgi:ATP-dependent DNA ligase
VRAPAGLHEPCEPGLKVVVSRRAGSVYESGPSHNWLMTKN